MNLTNREKKRERKKKKTMSTEEEGFGINTPLSVLLIRFHPLF
jgi:hypothetical protein